VSCSSTTSPSSGATRAGPHDSGTRDEIPGAQADVVVVAAQQHQAINSDAQTERLSLEQLLKYRSAGSPWTRAPGAA
jgi:hypothetical protein